MASADYLLGIDIVLMMDLGLAQPAACVWYSRLVVLSRNCRFPLWELTPYKLIILLS